MADTILINLLKEYDQKRLNAELDLERRKKNLYNLIPRLEEIDNELNSFGINTAKNILNNSNNTQIAYTIDNLKQKTEDLKKEKELILKENNYPLDYLTPNYECKICKDSGYITDKNYHTVMCSCLKQKLINYSINQSNLSKLDSENFNNFNEMLFSDETDLAKYKFNISPRKNILNIKNKCIEFINNFDNPEYKNLLFVGSTGLGKSFMSNCIAKELLEKNKTVIYQTSSILLEKIIKIKMNKDNKINENNFLNSILNCDLLIIDDLGTEFLNSMTSSELYNIINTRTLNLNKITKTIISTNLNINEIFERYEERIGSRIAGYYNIYYFFGDDLRFKKNRKQQF